MFMRCGFCSTKHVFIRFARVVLMLCNRDTCFEIYKRMLEFISRQFCVCCFSDMKSFLAIAVLVVVSVFAAANPVERADVVRDCLRRCRTDLLHCVYQSWCASGCVEKWMDLALSCRRLCTTRVVVQVS